MTDLVFEEQHVGQHVFGCEECRVTGTLIIFTSLDSCTDEALSGSVLICANRNSLLDREEISIVSDRTNMIFRDLVVVGGKTTVANQDCTSDFLVQHHAHFALDPSDYIEIGNINLIVAIDLLLLVNGLRAGGTLEQGEYFFLLHVALDVTLRTRFVFCDVGECGTNAAKRCVANAAHNLGDPVSVALDPLRGVVQFMIFREQPFNAINTIVFSMSQEAISKGSHALCVIENGHFLGMGKGRSFVTCAVKYVILHIKSFSFIIVVLYFFFVFVVVGVISIRRLTDEKIQNLFLIFVHRVDDIFNCLFCHFFFLLFCSFFRLLFGFIGGMKNDICRIYSVVVVPNNSFEFGVLVIAMS